jgi:hypothetical protein
MATLSSLYTRADRASVVLLPVAGDPGAQALAAAPRFGPFAPGDSLVVSSTQSFHMLAGDVNVVATTSNPRVLAGVYKFTVPDGCTYVSLVDSADAAGFGQAYKG